MRHAPFVLAALVTLGACDSAPGPLVPEPGSTPPDTLSPEGPLGPQRPYGSNPALASQSQSCPQRCIIRIDGLSGRRPTDLNEVARILAHDDSGPWIWNQDTGAERPPSLRGTLQAHALTDWSYAVGQGSFSGSSARRAFLWTDWGGVRGLGTLGGSRSAAFGSTSGGEIVVGWAETNRKDAHGDAVRHPFRWTPETGVTSLGTLGGSHGAAHDVNSQGNIVGWAENEQGRRRAFLWTSDNGMRDLGALDPASTRGTEAHALNDMNWVVGTSGVGSVRHAFVWTPEHGIRDLAASGRASVATDVNNWEEVVGYATGTDARPHAFVWRQETGMVRLDEDGGIESRALAINSWGDILGEVGYRDGSKRTVVWAWEENLYRYRSSTTPPSGQPVITITFDDGWRSTYTRAYPVLQKHGLKANVGVITSSVGNWSDFLTLPQLKELDAAGWSIVSHTVSHPHLTQVSSAELERQLRDSQQWIRDQGFRTTTAMIVPYHDWGPRERTAIQRFYSAARGYTANYFWPSRYQSWSPEDPYELTSIEPEYFGGSFMTPEGREALRRELDRVVAEGRFVDVFFHNIRPEQESAFRETIALLARYRDYVQTYAELFPEAR